VKSIVYDFSNMMAEQLGPAQGIRREEIDALAERGRDVVRRVQRARGKGWLRWFDLPYQRASVDAVKRLAAEMAGRYRNCVVLGIGGSALGSIALRSALLHPWHNALPDEKRSAPRLFVLDNVDPDWLAGFFDVIDPEDSCFNVISKSGSTAETMSQFLLFRQALQDRLGDRYAERIVVTTDAKSGSLRPLVQKEGFPSFVVPDGVGGRFSVLSPVGLFPAAVVGIDIDALLAGAAQADTETQGEEIWHNRALLYALLQWLNYRRGKPVSVMMPYSQALRDVADWYRQLWAESLGKKVNRAGQEVFVGPTPVKALGVTDQHSQMQLYIEGPHDKVITFLRVGRFGHELPIPRWTTGQSAIDYLGEHSFNELFRAEGDATAIALTEAGRANGAFILPELNAHTLGQLLFTLEVATAYSGELYDIDAFDQPGVEAGKIATYALLGRSGYEKRRQEIETARANATPFVV